MNYHRSHVASFARVSSVLYHLASCKKIVWGAEHEQAFQTLKQLAISAPMLAHPAPEGLMILDTDASGGQIGADLSQVQGGVIKPIAYASHVLMKPHRKFLYYSPGTISCCQVLSPFSTLFARPILLGEDRPQQPGLVDPIQVYRGTTCSVVGGALAIQHEDYSQEGK